VVLMAATPVDHGMGGLESSFGRVLVIGYLVGFMVVFCLMLAIMTIVVHGVPLVGGVFASVGVAVQAGIMGAVIAIGPWSARHERELYR
jgi:hypothetical protein